MASPEDTRRFEALESAAAQESQNRALEQENALLHQQLMALAGGVQRHQLYHLDSETRRRQETLQEQRRLTALERQRALQEQSTTLHRRLQQIQRGKDAKQLTESMEAQRQTLEAQCRAQAQQRQANLEHQNKLLQERLVLARSKGKDSKRLDDAIEAHRKTLEGERRQQLEAHTRALQAHNQAMQERLAQVAGDEEYHSRKFSPEDQQATEAAQQSLEDRRKAFYEQKQREKTEKEAVMRAHRTQLKQTVADGKKMGRDTKSLDPQIEAKREVLKKQRAQHLQQRQDQLDRQKVELRQHTGVKIGRDAKVLDPKVEAKRKALKKQRRQHFQEREDKLQQQEVELKRQIGAVGSEVKVGVLEDDVIFSPPRSARLKSFSSPIRIRQHKNSPQKPSATPEAERKRRQANTHRGKVEVQKVTLATHRILVKPFDDASASLPNYTKGNSRYQPRPTNNTRSDFRTPVIPSPSAVTPAASTGERTSESQQMTLKSGTMDTNGREHLRQETRAFKQRLAQVDEDPTPSQTQCHNKPKKKQSSPTSVLDFQPSTPSSIPPTEETFHSAYPHGPASLTKSLGELHLEHAERRHAELQKHHAILLQRLAQASSKIKSSNSSSSSSSSRKPEVFYETSTF